MDLTRMMDSTQALTQIDSLKLKKILLWTTCQKKKMITDYARELKNKCSTERTGGLYHIGNAGELGDAGH